MSLSQEVPQRTRESSYLGLRLMNLPLSTLRALHVEAPPTCSPKRVALQDPICYFQILLTVVLVQHGVEYILRLNQFAARDFDRFRLVHVLSLYQFI